MNNKEVYIVGGGTSLKSFDFSKLANKDTIIVNKGIFYVPNPTYFITMDYIFYKLRLQDNELRKAFDNIKCTKIFIVNMACKNMKERQGQIIDIKNKIIYELNPYDVIIKSKEIKGIGLDFNDFRSGENSGHCALQLAILLGYEKIHLLGMDFVISKKNTHFHEGYIQGRHSFYIKLRYYYTNFFKAINEIKHKKPNIEIYNYSKISPLTKILPTKELRDII